LADDRRRSGAQPATELISVTPSGASADEVAAFGRPQWSANGHVVFTSASAKLVPGDTNGRRDVFVRDLATGTTTLVSTGLNGLPPNNDSDDASISADGRYVAFGSLASNRVAGDTNSFSDVFVRDLETGTTTRLSVPPGGAQANGHSALGSPAMISANGRFVAFSSTAQNLAPGKPDFTREVYVADREAGTVARASVPQGGGWANGASDAASVSNDGVVAFQSAASNLVANDGNGARDVFLRDTSAGMTLLASHAPTGGAANGASSAGLPGITPDGTRVVFASAASNRLRRHKSGRRRVPLRTGIGRLHARQHGRRRFTARGTTTQASRTTAAGWLSHRSPPTSSPATATGRPTSSCATSALA
jgi:Tol biopolymer transport system component